MQAPTLQGAKTSAKHGMGGVHNLFQLWLSGNGQSKFGQGRRSLQEDWEFVGLG